MRAGTGLIITALAIGVPALLVATTCSAWIPSDVCGPGGYVGIALVALAAAGLLLGLGLVALAGPKPRDPFAQPLNCPQCAHLLEAHPELDRWYCRTCGRYYRSHLETALFQRREAQP